MRKIIHNKFLKADGDIQWTKEHYNEITVERFQKKKYDTSQPNRMARLLKGFKAGRFIELGCGIAPHCVEANKVPNSEVWGLDWADELIVELRKENPEINYVVGDVRSLPFKDEYFDHIAMGELIEHMDNPALFLREAFRTLKVGGTLALSTPLDDEGERAPVEHIWGFKEEDICNLLSTLSKNVETDTFTEGNDYIIGYAKKS